MVVSIPAGINLLTKRKNQLQNEDGEKKCIQLQGSQASGMEDDSGRTTEGNHKCEAEAQKRDGSGDMFDMVQLTPQCGDCPRRT